MWYNVNWNKLVRLLLPTFLRKKIVVTFFDILITPISRLYYLWVQFRNANLYTLSHTGQVCYLRKLLNDNLDPSQRRIEIGGKYDYSRWYVFTHPERKPVYLGAQFLYSATDYSDTGVDFIIRVPQQLLTTNNYDIKALVNEYKEGAKRFKIEAL